MTITRQQRCRIASVLLLLSSAMIQDSRAQDSPVSLSAASNNFASASSDQDSPQQAETDLPPQTGPKQLTNYVEAGGDYLTLTNGFGYWSGGYARGVVASGHNIWNAEVNGQHEFGDSGVYLAAGDTYNFNPDWYGSLTAGSSVGGFFWPRFRS